MDLNSIASTFLDAVISAAAAAAAAAVVYGIKKAATYLKGKTDNDAADRFIDEAASAVSTAVTFVSQTYVDALKANGAFTKDAQEKAAAAALETAKGLLTEEAAIFLAATYGSAEAYLTPKIEAEVRIQKLAQPVALDGIVVQSESTTDTATVAATTAAATAAAVAQNAIAQQPACPAATAPVETADA